jgi:hypothetical protein
MRYRNLRFFFYTDSIQWIQTGPVGVIRLSYITYHIVVKKILYKIDYLILLSLFQFIRRSSFSRYIAFIMYLDRYA